MAIHAARLKMCPLPFPCFYSILFFIPRIQRILSQPLILLFLPLRILLFLLCFVFLSDGLQFFFCPCIVRCGNTRKIGCVAVLTAWLYFSISDYLITLNRCGALRAVRLRPTSFRNSLYTLILNILFIFPDISPSCHLTFFCSFFALTRNINSCNTSLPLSFSI